MHHQESGIGHIDLAVTVQIVGEIGGMAADLKHQYREVGLIHAAVVV
jgi:hypothetical protein